jgi:hypothetical protein
MLSIALCGFGVRTVTAKNHDHGCKAAVPTQSCQQPVKKTVTCQAPAPVVVPTQPCCNVVDTKKAEHDAHEAAEACARAQEKAAKEQAKALKEEAKAQYKAAKEQAHAIHEQAEAQYRATMDELHGKNEVQAAICCPAEKKEEVAAVTPQPVVTPEPPIIAVLPAPEPITTPAPEPTPAPTPMAAAQPPKQLPKTAGSMDLIGLIGLLSMATGLGTRFRRW